jgi:acetyl-CoA acyltransferase
MAHVLNAVLTRNGLSAELIDDVVIGCVTQLGDQSTNLARFAVLSAGWPDRIPGVTINRACGSSQQAVDYAAMAVATGQADIVVAGGVESMSRVPLGAARKMGMPYGPTVLERYDNFSFNQGESAELIASKWSLSRTRLDEFSVESHMKAAAAQDGGKLKGQIIGVRTEEGVFDADEGIRPETSVERLSALKPVFQSDGVIHAGNSSQIADGASAVLVMTAQRARELGLNALVRYRGGVAVGDDPRLMLTGPIPATRKLLERFSMSIQDVGLYEVNEAFAPVPLAWLKDLKADSERLNVHGGAIATGHPLGASGTSLMTRLIHAMHDRGEKYGLQAVCESGGTANATLLELVES